MTSVHGVIETVFVKLSFIVIMVTMIVMVILIMIMINNYVY